MSREKTTQAKNGVTLRKSEGCRDGPERAASFLTWRLSQIEANYLERLFWLKK